MENSELLKKAYKRRLEMAQSGELVVSYNPMQKIRNLRAANAKVTIAKAVKAQCWQCMGGSADEWDPDTRKNIRECTARPDSTSECFLWPFRPYK